MGDVVRKSMHFYPFMARQQAQHRMRDHRQPGAAGYAGQHGVVRLDFHHLARQYAFALEPGLQPQAVRATGAEGKQRFALGVFGAMDRQVIEA
ncbi:hypothetical protein D3C73_1177610 [compost metagenome]